VLLDESSDHLVLDVLGTRLMNSKSWNESSDDDRLWDADEEEAARNHQRRKSGSMSASVADRIARDVRACGAFLSMMLNPSQDIYFRRAPKTTPEDTSGSLAAYLAARLIPPLIVCARDGSVVAVKPTVTDLIESLKVIAPVASHPRPSSTRHTSVHVLPPAYTTPTATDYFVLTATLEDIVATFWGTHGVPARIVEHRYTYTKVFGMTYIHTYTIHIRSIRTYEADVGTSEPRHPSGPCRVGRGRAR
jgi:hypothetical protein